MGMLHELVLQILQQLRYIQVIICRMIVPAEANSEGANVGGLNWKLSGMNIFRYISNHKNSVKKGSFSNL